MKERTARVALAMLAGALLACSDTERDVAAPLSLPYGPLKLNTAVLSAPGEMVVHSSATREVDASEALGASGSDQTRAANSAPEQEPAFWRREFVTGFTNDQRGAYAQMITGFFGNILRHTINMALQYNGRLVPTFPFTEQWSWLFPNYHEGYSNMGFSVPTTCGHTVSGSGTRVGWMQVWLPTAPSGAILGKEDTQVTGQTSQTGCSSHEEDVLSPGAGGLDDPRADSTQWYLCRYEIWLDVTGQEVSRRLLYCSAL